MDTTSPVLAASNIATRVEVQLSALDEASKHCRTSFSVAQGVEQILGSAAEMNDAGNMVLFDKEGSASIPGSSPEAAIIRRALAKAAKATAIHRRRNTFFIPLWAQPPQPPKAKALFTRRGAK